MSDAPSISIIIPVYNVEKYLDACLNSVFAQNFDSYEVICVDDGSTDSSPEILARFAGERGNLRIMRKENGGQATARNAGMCAARGKYILFVDSDDRMLGRDALAGMFRRAEETRADLVFFGCEIEYATPELARANHNACDYMRRENAYPDGLSGRELFVRMVDRGDYFAGPVLNLYRRDFLERHGLRFPEGYLYEDQLFTIQCMNYAQRTAQFRRCCYLYNIRAGSTMTGTSLQRSAHDHYEIAAKMARFYREDIGACADRAFRAHYFLWMRKMCVLGTQSLRKLPRSGRRTVLQSLSSDGLRLARADRARDPFRRAHRKLRRALSRAKRALLRKS